MTHAEIKAAFMDECPVIFNGVRYRRVSALIYRKNPTGTGLVMQAELLDQNYRAVVIVSPERIEPAKEDKPA